MRQSVLTAAFIALALATSVLITQASPSSVVMAIGIAVIFIMTFVNSDWGLFILIFSMLLSPEITTGVTGRATLGRGVTLRLEDVLLVVIGLSWFARTALRKELGLLLKTSLNKPILFYMLACVLSTGFGLMAGRVELKTGALYVLKYFEYFIIFFMMVNHARNGAQTKRFVACILITALVVSIAGLFQIPSGERVSAPFEGQGGEPNTLGGYLLFIMMVAAGIATKIRHSKQRSLLILLILFILPPLLFTQSRSSYLGLLAAGLALSFMVERRLIVFGLLILGLVVSPLFLPEVVKQRVLYTFTQPEEPGQFTIGELRLDTSTSARLQSWLEVARDFQNHPFWGYGITGYGFVDVQFPRVLAETGLIGLAAFLYLLYAIFKLALERMRQTEDFFCKGLSAGFLSGFIGLVAHSFGANTFILVRIMEPFWFLLGIIYVLPISEATQAGTQPVAQPAGRNRMAESFPAARGGVSDSAPWNPAPALTFGAPPGKSPHKCPPAEG